MKKYAVNVAMYRSVPCEKEEVATMCVEEWEDFARDNYVGDHDDYREFNDRESAYEYARKMVKTEYVSGNYGMHGKYASVYQSNIAYIYSADCDDDGEIDLTDEHPIYYIYPEKPALPVYEVYTYIDTIASFDTDEKADEFISNTTEDQISAIEVDPSDVESRRKVFNTLEEAESEAERTAEFYAENGDVKMVTATVYKTVGDDSDPVIDYRPVGESDTFGMNW